MFFGAKEFCGFFDEKVFGLEVFRGFCDGFFVEQFFGLEVFRGFFVADPVLPLYGLREGGLVETD